MKNRKNIICWFMLLCGMILSSSCNDFLNIVPKGQKIPTTLADYEALLRYEYNIARTPVMNALYLLNDRQVNKSGLNSATLTRANYLWDESADRIELNNASEDTYYCLYGAISTCNLLLENVPSATECTEAERNEVMAYARVIRALCYFNLVNFYADTYQSATAASKLAVPWITSANINAPSRQVTLEELYGYMLEDIRTALDNGLPEESMTVLHPNRAAAHALLARIYLQMGNYEDALHYAEEALKYKDELFDWVAYYEQHKAQLELPGDYTEMATPMDHNYVENYYFRHGENNGNQVQSESKLPVERGARFETGDARFLSRWKLRTVNQDTYYESITKGFFNHGGLTTCEMYLIKAECLARKAVNNDFSKALAALDAVRQTRILDCQPSTAATLAEVIELIRRTKDNELIFSIVPFADARRFNAEGTYARTMTKTWEGKTYTLRPDSHLWTMPFPAGATQNPGNGTITQNVAK